MGIRYDMDAFVELPDFHLFYTSCRKVLVIDCLDTIYLRIMSVKNDIVLQVRVVIDHLRNATTRLLMAVLFGEETGEKRLPLIGGLFLLAG
jgi:hypothetical protein